MTLTRFLSLLVLPLLASCALAPTTAGKYLHVMDSAGGSPMLQITLPSASFCTMHLKVMARKEKAKEALELSRCTEVSRSQDFRYRATLFEGRNRYSYEVETRTLAVCQQVVADIVRDAPRESGSVLVPCAAK